MKILFIGPYRQNDGWGYASREYLRSLRNIDHDIYTRPLYTNLQKDFDELEEFEDLENKKSESYDVVIQNALPHSFRNFGGAYNIGLSFFETSLKNSPWVNNMKLMDHMWVCSKNEQSDLEEAGISSTVMPLPVDINKFDRIENYNHILKDHLHEYIFYFIGENTTRKNLKDLIKAFHLEFNREDQVRLVLKVNNVGSSPEDTLSQVTSMCNTIKGSLGKYRDLRDYKSEIVIPNYLDEKELLGIHKDSNCFVVTSHGEAFCMPAFDAMLAGNLVITNSGIGVTDYIKHHKNGYVCMSNREPATANDRPLNFLYNSTEEWTRIDLQDLMTGMRSAYDNYHGLDQYDPDQHNKEHIIPQYSYDKISGMMNNFFHPNVWINNDK